MHLIIRHSIQPGDEDDLQVTEITEEGGLTSVHQARRTERHHLPRRARHVHRVKFAGRQATHPSHAGIATTQITPILPPPTIELCSPSSNSIPPPTEYLIQVHRLISLRTLLQCRPQLLIRERILSLRQVDPLFSYTTLELVSFLCQIPHVSSNFSIFFTSSHYLTISYQFPNQHLIINAL